MHVYIYIYVHTIHTNQHFGALLAGTLQRLGHITTLSGETTLAPSQTADGPVMFSHRIHEISPIVSTLRIDSPKKHINKCWFDFLGLRAGLRDGQDQHRRVLELGEGGADNRAGCSACYYLYQEMTNYYHLH